MQLARREGEGGVALRVEGRHEEHRGYGPDEEGKEGVSCRPCQIHHNSAAAASFFKVK